MGKIYEYFTAESVAAAAAMIQGGPSEHDRPFVDGHGVEPNDVLARIEALLADRSFADTDAEKRVTAATGTDGAEIIVLPDVRMDAFLDANPQRLREKVDEWVAAPGFPEDATADDAIAFLDRMSDLAQSARDAGQRVFCWVSA